MMHIGPEEAGRLDLNTYEGMMHHWNLLHAGDEPRGEPNFERLRTVMAANASVH